VGKSLALLEEREEGEWRYRLLEPVRQYASEQLQVAGEEAAVRGRHLAWAVALAEEAEPQLTGPEQGDWLERLEAEHDNLRAALAWSLGDGDAELGLQLAGALWRYWEVRGHLREGRRWLGEALSQGNAAIMPATLRARALTGAGNLAFWQGDYTEARALHEESLTLRRKLGDKQGIAASLAGLGNVAFWLGQHEQSRALYEEGLVLQRDLGFERGIAGSLIGLGNVAYWQGHYAEARALYEESLALSRKLGDRWASALSLTNLGNVASRQRYHAEARTLYEESLVLSRALGDRPGIAASLGSLGRLAYRQGTVAAAQALCEESLALARELGDRFLIADSLDGFALLAEVQGQPRRGARLWGAADALRQALGTPRPPEEQAECEQAIAALCAALGEEAFDAAWAAGQALPLDEAIALALEADAAG
jgi:tetratricopeptide (TPR) repeat protein